MSHGYHVIDENVLVVANRRSATAGSDCILACIEFLEESVTDLSLVIDDSYKIIMRYSSHCSYSGAPGVGDWYFVWALNNAGRLRQVRLELTDEGEYRSFPKHADLRKFDRDDRIYVAVTALGGSDTCLVNAVDSDYSHVIDALRTSGIDVLELCESELKPLSR